MLNFSQITRCTHVPGVWSITLLKSFVRIGMMLAYKPLDEKSLALLLNYPHDFLKHLVKNSETLFSGSYYEVAPPEYHWKAL